MARSPLRRRNPASLDTSIVFDGERVEAQRGENLVAALWAAGHVATSRSAKYRRPRGAFCLRGDCGTCLVRIDGRPNRRACMASVGDQTQVEPQNRQRPDFLDPTRLVDHAFRRGIDHHHLMVRPRVLNRAMQTLARELTGFGHLPEPEMSAPAGHTHRELPVLVVGAGPAGRSVAEALEAAGIEHLCVDRRGAEALAKDPTWADARPLPKHLACMGVFAAYPGENLWAAHGEASPALSTFRARHVVVATGARDPMIPFPNNDRPGVVAARGLLTLLRGGELQAGPDRIVVVGKGAYAESMASALEARRVDPEQVQGVAGRDRVRALRTRDAKIDCDWVALAAPPAPAHELAAMAGAACSFRDGAFAIERDARGVCAQMGSTTVWAAGDVTGYLGPEAAYRDGQAVGAALIEACAPPTPAARPTEDATS